MWFKYTLDPLKMQPYKSYYNRLFTVKMYFTPVKLYYKFGSNISYV